MFCKREQRCFIKILIARGKNARQCHTALLKACDRETLPHRTVVRWAYTFRRVREDVHQCHTAILLAVEQSVRRLVQQDADMLWMASVVYLMCGDGLEEITSDH